MEVMKHLWDAKLYGYLGRLEKIQEGSMDICLSNSRVMSGTDESMYGSGTQSASNIDHSDRAHLFNLDVQTGWSDESRYAIRKKQREAICILLVPMLVLQKSRETQSC